MPAEVRNNIYKFTMDIAAGQEFRVTHDSHQDWDRLNLSFASRQLFVETAQDNFEAHLLPVSGTWWMGDHDWWSTYTPMQKAAVRRIATEWKILVPRSSDHHWDPVAWKRSLDPVYRLHGLRQLSGLRELMIVNVPRFVRDDRALYVNRFRQEVQNQDLEVEFRDTKYWNED
jgi:hypothetical protein